MADEYVLKGPESKFKKIDQSIGELFLSRAKTSGNKIFQINAETGKEETYDEVKRRSIRVAIFLRQKNIKPADVVLICCRNNSDNIVPLLAAQYLGAYVCAVDQKHSVAEVRHAIELSKPKIVFVESANINLVCTQARAKHCIQIENALKDYEQPPLMVSIGRCNGYPDMLEIETNVKGEDQFVPEKVQSTSIACILLSSGTTSLPKGICLTHWGLLNAAYLLIDGNQMRGDVVLHSASFFWISAWAITSLCLIKGGTRVISPHFTGEQFLRAIEKYKVNYTFTSNVFSYQVTDLDETLARKYDTSSLFSIVIGGSTMAPQQLLKLRRYLPHTHVNLGYGSTETNFISFHNFERVKEAEDKVSSSGQVIPDGQLKIVDLDTGRALGPNRKGEILVKTPYKLFDYYNYSNPDAFDGDGYYKTGDLGYYDEDEYLYVTDRINDVFKYRTNQISPVVLEEVLLKHPAVAEAVVFGVPHDVDRGHAAACVVLKPGTRDTAEDDLLEFVNSKVSDVYQLRGGLIILDRIPTTPSGKYQRRFAREKFVAARRKG